MTPFKSTVARCMTGAVLSLPLASPSNAEELAYKAPFTVMRDHSRWHIRADGSSERLITLDMRVDKEDGIQAIGQAEVEFNHSLSRVDILEAYTLLPDGRRVDVSPDKIRLQEDRSNGDNIYSDTKTWVIIFPQVQVGARVIHTYRLHQHTSEFPGHFAGSDYFPPSLGFESSQLEVQVDPGIAIGNWSRGMKATTLEALPGDTPGTQRFRFEFKQPALHASEPGMVDIRQFAPGLTVSSFAHYSDIARAYASRARDKSDPTAAIRARALELTREAHTVEDKVRVLVHWVARHIRYVGVYVGAGGFVPHDAQSVLDNQYGDCKDHAVLLEALLRAVGIDSTTALVNSGTLHEWPQMPTHAAFDHAITYIPELDRFVDSTAEFARFGVLPWGLYGQQSLLVNTGEAKRIPHPDLSRDHSETRVEMELVADGSVTGRSLTWMHGALEAGSRHEHADLARQPMERVVTQWLSRSMESGRGHITHPEPRELEQPWQVEGVFELDPLVNIPGPSGLALPTGLAPGNIRDIARSPVYLNRQQPRSCSAQRHVEHLELKLPANVTVMAMPADVAIQRGVYEYRARYERTSSGLKAVRELQLRHPGRVCSPQTDRQWHEVAQVVRRDLRSQVVVR